MSDGEAEGEAVFPDSPSSLHDGSAPYEAHALDHGDDAWTAESAQVTGENFDVAKKKKKRTPEEKEDRKRRKKEKKRRKKKAREAAAKLKEGKKRKRHKKEGGDEFGGGGGDEDGTIHSEDDRPQKKKKKSAMTEHEASHMVKGIIDQMNAAVEEDEMSVAAGQPATAKLKLLDFAVSEISKPKWVLWFLQEGVCQALGRWLAPLSNGSLPNLTIRTKLLQLIAKMPLAIEHLQGTELGRRLVELWRSREEVEENRLIVRDLIHQLLRPVFGLRWSYKSVRYSQEGMQDGDMDPIIPKQNSNRGDTGAGSSQDGMQNPGDSTSKFKRARIPRATGYSFKIMPKSSFKGLQTEAPNKESESTMARISRMMAYKKSFGGRQATRAQNVSVSKSAG